MKSYRTQLIIKTIAGTVEDTIEVGTYKSLKRAYEQAQIKSSEVENNYSIYNQHIITINNKEAYQMLNSSKIYLR